MMRRKVVYAASQRLTSTTCSVLDFPKTCQLTQVDRRLYFFPRSGNVSLDQSIIGQAAHRQGKG